MTYSLLTTALNSGLSLKRLCQETGIDFIRINSGRRDENFTVEELNKIIVSVNRWKREVKVF